MVKVCVTGASGFLGKNLCAALRRRKDVELTELHKENTVFEVRDAVVRADIIFHLAGVNRPDDLAEFARVNLGYTEFICNRLMETKQRPKIVFASSTQAAMDTMYGRSKLAAERVIADYARAGGSATVFRFCGVYGKWCRPNYNSVVATWCDAIANDKPITVDDPNKCITLTYIDDVVKQLLFELEPESLQEFPAYTEVARESYYVRLGLIVDRLKSFKELSHTPVIPNLTDDFDRKLYATYLSYVPAYNLEDYVLEKADDRGTFAELLKLGSYGQVSVSTTHPLITRGNHYHNRKTEKFIVLDGEALIRIRQIGETNTTEFWVRGKDLECVDIPPGYTHSITNLSPDQNLITLFWISEVFDPKNPDTYYEKVLDNE